MTALTPIGDEPAVTAVKKSATKKKAAPKKVTPVDRRTSALPPLEPDMMNDILLAIHTKAAEIDDTRDVLERLIDESDELVHEAVDEGERYRDIAAAANRTVPWVQMSLRRVAGVSTHPASPIPDARIRRDPQSQLTYTPIY